MVGNTGIVQIGGGGIDGDGGIGGGERGGSLGSGNCFLDCSREKLAEFAPFRTRGEVKVH